MKYKFKINEEVYANLGWYPSFKFTVLRRFKHGGDNFYIVDENNRDWIDAERSIKGVVPHINPVFEANLSKTEFVYKHGSV